MGPSVRPVVGMPRHREDDMTAPYFDNSPQASMKRRLQGPLTGTPDSFLPETPGPGQYTLSEIGNATVSRPDHTLRNRILGGLEGVLHGIAATADPNDEGLAGQIGGFARGYSATTDLVERNKREQLAARIAAQTAQEEADLRRAQANYYNAGASQRAAKAQETLNPTVRPVTPTIRDFPLGPAQIGPDGKAAYITPSGTPPPGRPTAPRSPRSLAPQLKVGEDGFQYEFDPKARRWVQSMDAQGRPFRPRASGRAPNGVGAGAGLTPRPRPGPVAKTPAQWVAEVRGEHPNWTPEQLAAEARKRAGQ